MQAMTITHSPLGRKLKTPITLSIREPQTAADNKLQQYIINSLSWKMPALVPFAFDNEATMQLAKHLLRHRTASQGTLYQYLYGAYRFCK